MKMCNNKLTINDHDDDDDDDGDNNEYLFYYLTHANTFTR